VKGREHLGDLGISGRVNMNVKKIKHEDDDSIDELSLTRQ
jgi:hypothetical protein